MLEHAAHAALEAVGAAVEDAVEPAEEAFFLVMGIALGLLQEGGAQRRGEDQCHQYREAHAEHDRHGELLVDDACRAAKEGHGHEHCREHQADTHQRTLDLPHGFARGFQWCQPFLMHQALDVFHHHDGVVHQQADGQYHGVHGQHVDTDAEVGQQREGAEQHHRHRQGRNQRGAEVLQEQVHHQKDQHHRFDDGVDHRTDRGLHHWRGVVGIDHLDAFGQIDFLLLHLGLHGFYGFKQGQTQGQAGRRLAVMGTRDREVVGTQRDLSHVLDADLRAVGFDLDQDLLEFGRSGHASLTQHRGVELHTGAGRQTAELAGGDLYVLLADSVGNIAWSQLVTVELGRIKPDAHGIG